MLADRTTLTQYLIEERRRYPGASGELNALILDIALACKAISRHARGKSVYTVKAYTVLCSFAFTMLSFQFAGQPFCLHA